MIAKSHAGNPQAKAGLTGREATHRRRICRPRTRGEPCAGPHRANNFPRPAPDVKRAVVGLRVKIPFNSLVKNEFDRLLCDVRHRRELPLAGHRKSLALLHALHKISALCATAHGERRA